ncbi:MAG: YwaF family protein [Clostridia bacterium]|nr:YwaF family protein [Clostridia bacterium]
MPLWGFFGTVHIATLIAAVIINLILYFSLKRLPEKTQHIVLGVLSFAGWATIIYNLVTLGRPLEYLPLHLCSLNGMILPFAIWSRNKTACNLLLLWSFGALFALVALPYSSQQMVLLDWPFNFFYFPHVLEVGIPIIMFKLGLVKLDYKCIKSTILITFSAYTIIHFINLAINSANLLDFNGEVIRVSYMFSIYSESFANPVLDLFYSILPYDYWYFFLSVPIIILYLMCWYLPGIIADKKQKAK